MICNKASFVCVKHAKYCTKYLPITFTFSTRICMYIGNAKAGTFVI